MNLPSDGSNRPVERSTLPTQSLPQQSFQTNMPRDWLNS